MLYLPYGPYDGTAASETSGESKRETKGRREKDRDRERGNNKNWTRPTPETFPIVLTCSLPFHHPQISSPSTATTVLPEPLELAGMEGSPTSILPEDCCLPAPRHRSPPAERNSFIWKTLHRLGTKPPFPRDNIHLSLPQNKNLTYSSPAVTKSLQEDPPLLWQTYCQSTASSSQARFKTEPGLGPVPPGLQSVAQSGAVEFPFGETGRRTNPLYRNNATPYSPQVCNKLSWVAY